MDDFTKNLLKENFNSLVEANKDLSRSGEELKAITEAIKITVCLLKDFDSTYCGRNGQYSSQGQSVTDPLTKD